MLLVSGGLYYVGVKMHGYVLHITAYCGYPLYPTNSHASNHGENKKDACNITFGVLLMSFLLGTQTSNFYGHSAVYHTHVKVDWRWLSCNLFSLLIFYFERQEQNMKQIRRNYDYGTDVFREMVKNLHKNEPRQEDFFIWKPRHTLEMSQGSSGDRENDGGDADREKN